MKKKSFAIIAIAFFILVCLFPVLLLAIGFGLPSQYEDSFMGELKYKIERLVHTEGKRIVLVGGSSIPFSTNSEQIEAHFPEYQVVDFGMYAGMGTVAMLDLASIEMHEGDIFIISPEQNSQTLSCHFSGEAFLQAADGSFSMIKHLSSKRYEQLAAAFPVFAGKKLNYFINGCPAPEGIYARSSFNEYGDIDYPNRRYNIMSGGYQPTDSISFSSHIISEDFIQELNAFAKRAWENGALVYYRFPPMNQLAIAKNTSKSDIDSYYRNLQQLLDFPVLGNPHRSIMESGWFYDTNYHLNESGSIVFTQFLIEDIKILLQDTSPTTVAAVSIPSIPASFGEGDHSQEDCFTYLQTEHGWIVNGLTQKGQTKLSLIVPFIYQGEPVTGITDSLFLNNKVLRELTLQENIGLLYDGMFQGCTSFQRLILTGKSPSSYSVGDRLLEGADFLIYVPEGASDSYRRHYSWQQYSSHLVESTLLK